MREIKFRGKALADEEWIYGDLLQPTQICGGYEISDCNTIDGSRFPIYEETIGQWTGLHDKNGKEIYEGDIVKAIIIKQNPKTEDDYEEKVMTIVFDKAEFLLKDKTTAFGPTFYHLRLCKSLEVIGNIYENSDLLEGTK